MAVDGSVSSLLKEMKNWDKDKRFMAASDLTQAIVNSREALDVEMQKEVCGAFLNQLQDQSIDIQGNAVKCLAKIVGRFQQAQVGEVMGSLSALMLDGKAEVRDIYATCLKGLIAELPLTDGQCVCSKLIPHMMAGIGQRYPIDVREICADVLHDLLRCYGGQRAWWPDLDTLSTSLLQLLASKAPRASVQKKAILCIGALGNVLSDKQLQRLIKGLMNDIRDSKCAFVRRISIQCVGTVSRSVGPRLGLNVAEITPLFLSICENAIQEVKAREMTNVDEAEGTAELVENCLAALESFVTKCTAQAAPYFKRLSELVRELLGYDPNYYPSEATEDAASEDLDVEFDDEGFGDSDDDDTSWKVRRQALKVLTALVRCMPEELGTIYEMFIGLLIERFAEREENVKVDVFHTFEELVKAAVMYTGGDILNSQRAEAHGCGPLESPGAGSTEGGATLVAGMRRRIRYRPAADALTGAIPQVVNEIVKQIKSRGHKPRQGALGLLKLLGRLMPAYTEQSMETITPSLLTCLTDSNSAIRLDALTFFLYQAECHTNAEVYCKLAPCIIPVITKLCSDPYYKIASQAFKTCAAFVYPLHPVSSDGEKLVLSILEQVKIKMALAEIDQEVKESTLVCFGHVTALMGDVASFQPLISACMKTLLDRLKNEVTRRTALGALRLICLSQLAIPMEDDVPPIVSYLASLINHHSRSFRQSCIGVLTAVIRKHGTRVEYEVLGKILRECAPYITDSDLHIADLCIQLVTASLSTANSSASIVASYCLEPILKVCHSPVLQGHVLTSILEFFGSLVKHSDHFNFDSLFQSLSDVSGLKETQSSHTARQVIATLAKCLARIVTGASGNVQKASIDHFLKVMKEKPDVAEVASLHQVELSILALGEAGLRVDLSQYPGAWDALMELLNSPLEEIRAAAAVALGYATCGSMAAYVKALVEHIRASQRVKGDSPTPNGGKIPYLLLTSLREVISQHQSGGIGDGRSWGCGHQVDTAEEAEVQQKLTEHLKPHVSSVVPILEQYADSEEEGDRAVVAECLGKLLIVDPKDVSSCIVRMLQTNDSARKRSTAVTSVRFAASSRRDTSNIEGLKENFIACVKDPEMMVRKAALLSLNTLCLPPVRCTWIAPLIPELLDSLWSDSQVNSTLVREVDLGPFKHKVDDGLPLRKSAYQATSALLNAFPDITATPRIVDFIIAGVQDHEEVQALCCQLLTDLCHLSRAAVMNRLDNLMEPVDAAVAKAVKQSASNLDRDRVADTLRLYARSLRSVWSALEAEERTKFNDKLQPLLKSPVFQQYWNATAQDDLGPGGGHHASRDAS